MADAGPLICSLGDVRPPPFPYPPFVLRGGLRLREWLNNAADLFMPAEVALCDLSAGMQRTQIAGLMVTLGIADAMGDGWRPTTDIAIELELDRDVTHRILEVAAGSRLARMDRRGRIRLSRIGLPLRSTDPHSVAAWVAHQTSRSNIEAYCEMATLVRGGSEPSGFRRATGESLWDYLTENPADGARFGEAMSQLTAIDIQAMSRAYPWPHHGTICDVGGGTGTFLAAILKRRPSARGILVDSSEVLPEAQQFFRSVDLEDRIELTGGDLFGKLDARADVYILKWILHNWNDETCRQILRRLRESMPPGARVVTIDQHCERNRPNAATSITDLHMFVACEGGRERSPEEVCQLIRDAGLRPGRVRHAGLHMFVEGISTH
jgi:O-methyltransferase domain